MSFAEVAVGVKAAPGRTFSYAVPPGMRVLPGHIVQVPFGSRQLPGLVVALADLPSFEGDTRPISRVVDEQPWLSSKQIELASWVSNTYLASLYDSAALMIPPGFRQKVVPVYAAARVLPQLSLQGLDDAQDEVLRHIQAHGPVPERELTKRFGQKRASVVLGQLIRKRLAVKAWKWRRPSVAVKLVSHATLAVPMQEALAEAALLQGKAPKQATALEIVAASGPATPAQLALAGVTASVLRTLAKRGLLGTTQERVDRDPLSGRSFPGTSALQLTEHQARAWSEIDAAIEAQGPSVFLLQGVTGSGKTELYLRALEKVVSQGRRGMVLVPEISLTPQTIERLSGRFPGRVAVLHSGISPGEHFDQWFRIHEGDFDVVVGSRSAIFAPQPNLGLIVLDEEHEWTFKQQELAPRYHARDVALRLGGLTGATVILGSATPQVESYHKAQQGEYRLLELPYRVGVPSRSVLPPSASSPALADVTLVDMRQELKEGNRSVFSRPLRQGIEDALLAHQQVVLFLNRRGASTFVQCRDCGYVARCRRCSTTITYHASEPPHLLCHQCGLQTPPPLKCPECWGPNIRYMGMGTERLEHEVSKTFPDAMTLRWDRDVAQDDASHEAILRQFLDREADILIGTQMIAKGLHLPDVTLVGVVNADIGLYSPDFRAAERVFQVLCQVAGRAGRGVEPGRVVVQTYSPKQYAIVAAAKQDFRAFYNEEVRRRAEIGYPPYSRLVRLLYLHTNPAAAKREAERMHQALKEQLDIWAFPSTSLIGPAPAFLERLRGRYRWQILMKGPDPTQLLTKLPIPDGWVIDVDPMSLT